MESPDKAAPIPWARRIGWTAGDAGFNLYWGGIGIFAYFFYTDVMGLSPMWAGFAFAVASVWDAITDPIMGAIADRTRTRFGRFRPWMLFGSVPCAITFAIMFWTPPLAGIALVLYATLTHVLFRTTLTAVGIPYSALSARMTHDSAERGTVATLRMMFAATGALVVAFLIPRLVELVGDERRAYFVAACLLGAAATVIILISFFSTYEPPEEASSADAAPRPPIFKAFLADLIGFWSTLRHNGPLARLFAILVLTSISITMNSKVMLYWIKYDLADQAVMKWLLPLPAIVLIVAAPFWNWVSKRRSKRDAWILGSVLQLASLLAFFMLNPHDHLTLAVVVTVGAIGASAGMVMFWAMLPDTVEYNQWIIGERSEARIFGFAAFGQKVAIAINAVVLGQLLTLVGFKAGAVQSAAILADLRAIMCLIPIAGVVGTWLLIWKYPITTDFHARIRQELAERAASPAE